MDTTIQWVIGIAMAILVAIVSAFIKHLFNEIKLLESRCEEKRKETRDHLLELINTKFDAIWESLREVKDKL